MYTNQNIPSKEAEAGEAREAASVTTKKRRLFEEETGRQAGGDDIPVRLAHVRESERKVRDQFYLTVGNLVGRGMSLDEASIAVKLVIFDNVLSPNPNCWIHLK